MNRAVIVASFGNRDEQIMSLVANLRKYWPGDMPIILYTDRERTFLHDPHVHHRIIVAKDLLWKDHPRWPIRNTNLWLARAARDEDFNAVCCLNDDMRVCGSESLDGFALAEKFGICVPINPRVYVKYNAMGADTTKKHQTEIKLRIMHAPACNVSPMFVRRGPSSFPLLDRYAMIMERGECYRGTLAFWLASYRSGVCPLYLPEQWCVGASNAAYIKNYTKRLQGKDVQIEPMMLHYGQAEVRKVFPEYK